MLKRLKLVPVLLCVFMMVFSLPLLAGKDPFDDFFNRFFEDFPKYKDFTMEYVAYNLQEPEQGKFEIIVTGLLPKKEGKQEYTVFLSGNKETVIKGVDIVYHKTFPFKGSRLNTETKITKTVDGYPVVLATVYFLESGAPTEIDITLQIEDRNSFYGEGGFLTFSRVTAAKTVTIFLPQDYAVLDCNYPIFINYLGGVRISLSNPTGQKIEFYLSAARIRVEKI